MNERERVYLVVSISVYFERETKKKRYGFIYTYIYIFSLSHTYGRMIHTQISQTQKKLPMYHKKIKGDCIRTRHASFFPSREELKHKKKSQGRPLLFPPPNPPGIIISSHFRSAV